VERTSLRADRGPVSVPRPAARRISPAHGSAEREADSTASRVLRNQAPCACGGGCPTCASPPAARMGGGRPLDPGSRAFFETRFGRDLGEVRVHDDAGAATSARMIGAKAFTVGADIVFARGHHAPDSSAGRALMAHELAHVVQHGADARTVFRSEDKAVPSAAEVLRLYDEMKKLAAKNAWSGVARYYEQVEAMGPEGFALATDAAGLHTLAAEAARNAGDTRRYLTLLQRTLTALAGATGDEAAARREQIEQAMAGLESAYGTVRISPRSEKKKAQGTTLVREVMPFPVDERRSIEAAAAQLAASGSFSGMLPAGVYLLDGQTITVIAKTENSFLWGS
jgi:hypothetical protein